MTDDSDDIFDDLPSLNPDDPETYLKITEMRTTAETVHGKETIEDATLEYVRARVELITHPLDPSRKEELQKQTNDLEQKYGYEVLTGVPRVTWGDHPVHDWRAQLRALEGGS